MNAIADAFAILTHGFPLALQVTIGFGGDRRHADLTPAPAIPGRRVHQLHDECRDIDAIRLRTPVSPIDGDARRVNHHIGNAVCGQRAVQPKRVASRFITASHRHTGGNTEVLFGDRNFFPQPLEIARRDRADARTSRAPHRKGQLPPGAA